MKTKLDAIRAFTAAGYPLVPLAGKKPIEEEWETTPVGRHHEKTLLKGNYGVVLGPRDLVVDVDPRNYRNGDRPLDRLGAAIGGFPRGTYVTRTGAGGLHIFLRKPADISLRNSLPEYPGIEFKAGCGRQVVGPWSIHPETGKPYEPLQGAPDSVAAAPQALLDLAKRRAADLDGAGLDAYDDTDAVWDRGVALLARVPGAIQGMQGDAETFKTVCRLRDLGMSPKLALRLLGEHYNAKCVPPWSDEELRLKVANAYTYAKGAAGNAHPGTVFTPIPPPAAHPADVEDDKLCKSGWKLDGKKQIIRCFQNLLNYFALPATGLRSCFGYNEFARCVEIVRETPWGAKPGRAVEDVDLARMRAHLARNHGYDTGKEDLIDAMVDFSQRRRFHPVRTFLEGLVWDGAPRLDTWLIDYLGVDEDADGYVRAAARKTLCGAVARIYDPGCKFDHVLVLEGQQGIGKSGVCRVLGGPWFADFKMSAGEKDTVQMMQGKWIVEMADLHVARVADLDTLKSFLTRQVDEARFAYGRLPGRYPRQGIFIATFNPGPDGTYLKDDENRRWWPVLCKAEGRVFNFAGLIAVRDQLWAEAVMRYKKGEKLEMDTHTLQDAARAQQAERRPEHPWVDRVRAWLAERDRNAETRKDFYTAREIYVDAMSGHDSRFGHKEAVDAACAMRENGWRAGYSKRDGVSIRCYWRPGVEKKKHAKAPLDIFGDLM